MTTVTRKRIPHAAHYYGGGGHDLEEFVYAQPKRGPVPPEVPTDAEYQCGFIHDGVQHWVWTRRAPLSPERCRLCPKGKP